MESICKHCQMRIVKIDFFLGPAWRHQPAGAAFSDGIYTYCHSTVAEPPDDVEENKDESTIST